MNNIRQAISFSLILLSLTCFAWYYASSSTQVPINYSSLSKSNDIIIEHLIVQQYNEVGQMANYLETPLLNHEPMHDTHHLQDPLIKIVKNNQPAWTIQSKRAVAQNNIQRITFYENVLIHQDKSDQLPESTVKTEEITYYPKQQKASTLKEIVFYQPRNIVTSLGMNAFFDKKRIVLLNHVRASYAPNTV